MRQDASWNGKLVYTFGGGCNAGFHQGNDTGGVLNNLFLGEGYAVASSTLNVLDNNCSTVISAEAAMMVKEHFIDTYGPVQFTIGWGGLGRRDPAVRDRRLLPRHPGRHHPDHLLHRSADHGRTGYRLPAAGLLLRGRRVDLHGGSAAGHRWLQRLHHVQVLGRDVLQPGDGHRQLQRGHPVADQWNATTNPDGIICNANEQIVNQLGVDPKTGFPNSPSTTPACSTGWRRWSPGR